MSAADGLGGRKAEVLADTAVTLEQGEEGIVANEVIKKLLNVSVVVKVRGKPVTSLYCIFSKRYLM